MKSTTAILRELETVGSGRPELGQVESKLVDLAPYTRSFTVLYDRFVVSDLLEGYSYIIARSESIHQLTFVLEDGRQLDVVIEPNGDPALVAQRIAERLAESGIRLLQPALRPVSQICERGMLN